MRTEGGEEDEAAGGEDGAVLVPYYPYPPPYDRVSEDDLWDDLNFEHAGTCTYDGPLGDG